jgi:hypothetical protein
MEQHVQVQLSEDNVRWTDVPYTVERLAAASKSGEGEWLKLVLKGETPTQIAASYIRIVFKADNHLLTGLELGHVRLDALK